MKRIVFPTDFSETANEARTTAARIAQKFGAEVLICHVVPNIMVDTENERFGTTSVFPSLSDVTSVLNEFNFDYRLQEKLEDEMSYFGSMGISTSAYSAFGSVAEKVNAMVKEFNCDLIVLGTNGTTGISEEFMGSNAFQVCQWAKVPVITVRKFMELENQRIILASDFKEDEVGKVIGIGKMFRDTFNCKMDLLFVNTPTHFVESDDISRMAEKAMADHDLSDSQLIVYNSTFLENGVLRVAESTSDCALILFGNHGFSRIKMKVEYSIADHLISRSKVPVLSVKI